MRSQRGRGLAPLLLPALLLIAACSTGVPSVPAPTATDFAADTNATRTHGLTEKELNFARALVQRELTKEGAIATSVTVAAGPGTVLESNLGYACTSGRVLRVRLIGTFPHIVTTGPGPWADPAGDYQVRAIDITADARSGRACQLGVRTGKVAPEIGGVRLFIS